jgi:zinc transport system substrate-binding protein
MKHIKKFLLLSLIIFLISGCSFKNDDMENIDIYTTIYPINYLINYLYGDYSKIYSIYPSGVDIDTYELSERKIKEYSNSDLFVFNSLDIDKDYAVEMINKNSNLKVIDVSLGMNYTNSVEEIWLDPSNYLMMAQNIKNGLSEYITNPYLIEEIDNKYEDLKYDVSKIDANIKEVVNNANYTTIVADNNLFKFLEKYGITVISLEETDDLSTNTITEVKKLIEDKKIKYIYSTSTETNDTVKKIIEDNEIELITFNTMRSVDGAITNSNDNYLTIMDNNIDLLKEELYK